MSLNSIYNKIIIYFREVYSMKISLEWLNEFVDIKDLTVEEIVNKLTMSGLEVEEIEHSGAKFTNIITAQIKSIKQHPNADKLHLVDVDLGTVVKTVVCGAQNIQGMILLSFLFWILLVSIIMIIVKSFALREDEK